jgi:hypothetical protein
VQNAFQVFNLHIPIGATMTSPTTLQSQLLSRPGRRPRRGAEEEECGKKPKKVNSEVRKQQNRIASRNYRMSDPFCRSALLTYCFYRRKAQTKAPVPSAVDQGRFERRAVSRAITTTARSASSLPLGGVQFGSELVTIHASFER